jgi:serine/threonine protein kinase
MPDRPPGDLTASLAGAERREPICDRFEAGWQAGDPPPIEHLLPGVPPAERAELFVALLRVELEYRPGARAAAGEYRARFPDFAGLIDSVLRDPAETHWLVTPGGEGWVPHVPGYEVGDRLGQGGMGVVFRGRHVELDRPVAIKVVRGGANGRPDHLVRFHLEARAVARLSHPGVVTLYDFGQADGLPYFVMEYVPGGSLADRLNGAPADPGWAAGVVEQVARAVQYVHAGGIIHRDLKPANVLLAEDGTPKLADFGLARRLAAGDPGLTGTDAVVGSACYMSPEQARGDARNVGPAADVYGLGAILYECLTGRPPFRAASYAATVAQVLADDPPRPADLVAGLRPDLEAVCLTCLEKDPARRYPSAAALADDLAACRAGQPPSVRPATAAERHARWARRAGFEPGDELGSAAGTVTYRARQAAIGRSVRLKLAATPAAHAALRREAEALAGLDHPNVLRLYDYGEQFGQPYLVLEDPEGGTFRGPLAPKLAAELCWRLVLGLQEVHEHGIVHGALHTAAVVMGRDERPKIGDFVAARRVGDPPGSIPDWVPGGFLAPEARAGESVGTAADVYALGGILHDLMWGEPPPAAGPRRETEPALDAIEAKCLDPDPARRPKAGDVALALQLFLRPPPPPPPPDSSIESADLTVLPGDVAPARSTRFRLRVVAGPRLIGETFVGRSARLVIGRGKGNDVRLPGPHTSRAHCGVIWNDAAGCPELVDFGSHNGTFVNGERVHGRRRLAAGDEIRVADYVLAFEPLPAS